MKLIIDEEKIIDLLETEWGYEGIREEVSKLLRENGTPYNPTGDLISREDLKDHKFLTPQVKVIGGRHCGKTREQIIEAYQKGWNDCIEAIIDNTPTVEIPVARWDCYCEGQKVGYEKALSERPQGEWIIVDDCEQFIAKCSVCGRIEDSRMVKDYPFCHCGADMRKGGAEND